MITIFNRKEILITYTLEEIAKVRDSLVTQNIDYIIVTKSHYSYGYTHGLSYEYRIYVKRKDYDLAYAVVNSSFRR